MWARVANKLVIDPENWRAGLLTLLLRATTYLGFVVYLPSAYFSIEGGMFGIALIDTIALLAVIAMLKLDRVAYMWRAGVFCLVLYALSVGLLVGLGSIAQIYLFAFSMTTALLLGLRMGLIAAALSSITLLAVGPFGQLAVDIALARGSIDTPGWVLTTLNFTFVNTALTLAIGAVLRTVDKALKREIATRTSLDRERTVLRTLIDTLPDVVFTKDIKGQYITGNSAALEIFGLEREEQLVGMNAFDVHPHAFAESYRIDDGEVLAGQVKLNCEERIGGDTGKARWMLTTKVPLRDSSGEITGLLGISRDITVRKAAEAERDRLLAQLQLQIERLPIAYILTDANFHYTHWNPAAEQMYGYTKEEVLGKHPFDVIIAPEARTRVSRLFDDMREGKMNARGESEIRIKGGGTITCEWHHTPMFDEHGEFAGMLSLSMNITDRRRLEDQLRQAQKMEAVGQLAGGVAHDFNNLLTVIFGYSQVMLDELEPGDSMREPFNAINDAAHRAAALTTQLLAFSRQTMLQPKVLDLNNVVAETGKMLQRLIGEDIQFTTVLDPEVQRVMVDPGQLDQVLMNLTVNARDAMPHGGQLTIETSNVELSEEYAASHPDCTAGPHVMLALTDTGCGMTQETLSHIFEPFYTTKAVGKGTGLGLAMVFGIVQQSGGCIHVYSEVGHGTTFKIYFPAVSIALPESTIAPEKTDVTGTENVLLVEDDEAVRELALSILTTLGYTVLTAVDGADALRVVDSHDGTIDVLLTDVVMPNMSGPVLAKEVGARFPDVKVLFMSGYTDDAVVRHGLLQADVVFIQKPYTPSTLAQKLRLVLAA